jgi:16S rRNA (guanine966-N2)-methyltransferase
MQELPDLAIPKLHVDGVFTLEHSSHDWFDEHPHLMTSRPYGRTIVSLFRPPLPPEDEDEGEVSADESAPSPEDDSAPSPA